MVLMMAEGELKNNRFTRILISYTRINLYEDKINLND